VLTLYTAEFSDTPEMPLGFAIGIWLMLAGMIATIASAVCLLTRRILERRKPSRKISP
jgi:hypothetical protein